MMASPKKPDIGGGDNGIHATKILSNTKEWTVGELIELLSKRNKESKIHILVVGQPGSSLITITEKSNNVLLIGFRDDN